MSKSAIYTVQSSLPTVNPGDVIPLGSIIRRFGQNIRQDGNAITLCEFCKCSGYYKVNVNATVSPPSADPVKISLQKDGVDVLGANAQLVGVAPPVVAGLAIDAIVKNSCGGQSLLAVVYTGTDPMKIDNMTVTVERL